MGKKGLVSIFSRLVDPASPAASAASPPWPWPPCGTAPQTASFRAAPPSPDEPCCASTATAQGEMYRTVNSVFLDDPAADGFSSLAGDDDGWAALLPDDDGGGSFSTTTASEEWSEAVIRSLGSCGTSTGRFFFDDPGPLPPSRSSSVLAPRSKAPLPAETEDGDPPAGPDNAYANAGDRTKPALAEGSVAVALISGDPYGDFRASMEEMVRAHALRDWAALEELLACYLRINGKQHHHIIVGAFVDLLLTLSSSSSSGTAAETTTTTTTTSTTSTTTSSSSSSARPGSSRCTTTSTATAATSGASTSSAAAATAAAAAVGGKRVVGASDATSHSCAASAAGRAR